ncbi:MAG TPA: hypothetical protein VL171_11050 [Verrucomicrobiae bacterium]|nr:hypothetical protein [Verrucomicrobiae bacterium]
MKARCLTKILIAVAVVGSSIAGSPKAWAASPTNTPICTISTSRQFASYAHDRLLSLALCVYAERVKREWLRRMNLPDDWRDPIVIVVNPCESSPTNAAPVSWQTFQTDKHLKYQIYCCAPPRLDQSALLAAIVDQLCAEWSNREQPTIHGEPYIVPLVPLWLVQGLAASIRGGDDMLLSIARRSVAAGRPHWASALLVAKILPDDAAERMLFQADAWMFTESLLTLPNGAQKLRSFLSELGAQKSASNAFWLVYRRDFPQERLLEKWWSLQQVSRVSEIVAQNLTAEETAEQLEAILPTKLAATEGTREQTDETEIPINQLWHYTDTPWLKDVLKLKMDRLGALRGQAHPFYEPVIDRYIEAVNWLLQQNTVRFRRSVAKAASAQAAAEQRTRATTAYLNAAERIYAPEELSNLLTGYENTLNQSQQFDRQRRNPISDYLDKFDQ